MLSQEERDKLIQENIDLPKKIAFLHKGYKLDLDDMIQEGMVGLIKAAEKYDDSKVSDMTRENNREFGQYAYSWIKSHIFEYIIKNIKMVKVATTKAQRKLFFHIRKEKASKNKEWFTDNDVKSIADKYEVKEADVRLMELRMSASGGDYYYMGARHEGEDDNLEYDDFFVDEDSDPSLIHEMVINNEHTSGLLQEAVNKLPERNKDIIQKRFFSEEKTSLKELSKKYNVSIERIRQIEKRSLELLKKDIKYKI